MAGSYIKAGWLAEAVSLGVVLLVSPALAVMADSEAAGLANTRSAEEVVQRYKARKMPQTNRLAMLWIPAIVIVPLTTALPWYSQYLPL